MYLKQMHIRKNHILKIVISWTAPLGISIKDLELIPSSPGSSGCIPRRTHQATITLLSLYFSGIKPNHFPCQLALRIACDTEINLLSNENGTPLRKYPTIVFLKPVQTSFPWDAAFRVMVVQDIFMKTCVYRVTFFFPLPYTSAEH